MPFDTNTGVTGLQLLQQQHQQQMQQLQQQQREEQEQAERCGGLLGSAPAASLGVGSGMQFVQQGGVLYVVQQQPPIQPLAALQPPLQQLLGTGGCEAM